MRIAEERNFGAHQNLNNEETRIYIGQLVKLLEIFHMATKYLEGDHLPTVSMVVPTIMNALVQLEDPEVSKILFIND